VSGRDPETAFIEDVGLPLQPFSRVAYFEVDKTEQKVTAWLSLLPSSPFRQFKCEMIYKEGLGCTLKHPQEVPGRTFPPELLQAPTKSRKFSSIPWPDGDGSDINPQIQALVDESMRKNNASVYTRQIVVVHKGKLIAEAYAPGFTPTQPLAVWSISKSLTSAMIGMAIKQGYIKDQYQSAVVPQWSSPDDPRSKITIDQVLRMSTGIQFEENYGKLSDATQMLYIHASAVDFYATKQLETKPDGKWQYSSGSSNLLQRIIQNKFDTFHDYIRFTQQLFQKLGMRSAIFETDPSGTLVGSSYAWASARDLAIFGQLYLQDGIWKGEELFPPGWVKYTTTPAPLSKGQYGAQWWLAAGGIEGFPQDAYFARGYQGQGIAVIPSQDLVLTRLGMDFDPAFEKWQDHHLYQGIVKILNQQKEKNSKQEEKPQTQDQPVEKKEL